MAVIQTDARLNAALAKLPYFADLPAGDLAFLAERTRRERYHAATVIFLQDEPCRGLYIVETGLVRVIRISPEGREQVLRLKGPGDSFNEAPVFDRGGTPASRHGGWLRAPYSSSRRTPCERSCGPIPHWPRT